MAAKQARSCTSAVVEAGSTRTLGGRGVFTGVTVGTGVGGGVIVGNGVGVGTATSSRAAGTQSERAAPSFSTSLPKVFRVESSSLAARAVVAREPGVEAHEIDGVLRRARILAPHARRHAEAHRLSDLDHAARAGGAHRDAERVRPSAAPRSGFTW